MVRDGVSVGAYKPVASGASSLEQRDGFQLWQASGQRGSLSDVNPQHFLASLAPPVAAELEGKQVSDRLIFEGAKFWADHCELLIVEGAGGLMSPISWNMTNATLALEMKFPVVLVSENRLGVVNQVLTTWIAARSLGLAVCCVVLNEMQIVGESSVSTNERLLRTFINRYPDPPRITVLGRDEQAFSPPIQWQDLAS